jgi:hypothetical protein
MKHLLLMRKYVTELAQIAHTCKWVNESVHPI